MNDLEDCLKIISNHKIKVNDFVKNKYGEITDREIFIIDNKYTQSAYCLPTMEIKQDNIQLILSLEQANHYLNEEVFIALKTFNDLMDRYVNIYNTVQSDKFKVEFIEKFVKIVHDKKSKACKVYICYHNFLFFKREDGKITFTNAIKRAMRADPDFMFRQSAITDEDEYLLSNSSNNNLYVMRYPKINEHIIYSTTNKELKSTFTTENGFYKENELFNAIQSYLDITENDNCNILDPNLINNKEHFKNIMSISKMISI